MRNLYNKKILMLHQGSELYGSDKVFINTVNILKNYFEVLVILNNNGPLLQYLKLQKENILILDLAVLRRRNFNLKFLPLWLINFIKAIYKIYKLIKNQKVNIVYSNTSAVIVGAFAAFLAKVPHIWHIHEIVENPKFVKKFYSFIIPRFSHKIIVVSHAVKKHILNQNNKYSNRFFVVHNGFDWSIFQNQSSEKKIEVEKGKIVIGYFGRIHFWKGQDVLIDALYLLQKNITEFIAVLVGDVFPGYEFILEDMKKKVDAFHLREKVKFLGFRNDVPYLMSLCDIIVVPSKLPDPFPTTVLEAMVSGKAVVASNIGGIPEIIQDGINGVLFQPNKADDLASKIYYLITHKKIRISLGINAKKYVLLNFSLVNYKENLLKVLNK